MPHPADADMERAIESCQECHEICVVSVAHALAQGGSQAEAAHVRLLLDCAELCQTAANFMLRDSDLHALVCRACSEVCARCAGACARFDRDEAMKVCAEVCRGCSAACAEMMGLPIA